LADLDLELPFALGRPLASIFFGGGTPSLFSGAAIARFLDGVRARLPLREDCEITLETNPGTAEFDRFEAYLGAGVNRISFGVQSLDDGILKRLGRIHSADEARHAVRMARAAGVGNINLDLMYALPGQTLAGALADLSGALELAPEHLSHYQLTLEPQTVFARFPPQDLPDEDLLIDMQEQCQAKLAQAGYAQYEVSAYAQSGRQSRHNHNYWLYGDYLAVGAGGHAKYTQLDGAIRRRVREKLPTRYLQLEPAARIVDDQLIAVTELPFEFMLNALRLRAGFAARLFRERTGCELEDQSGFHDGLRRGLLQYQDGWVAASELGYRFLNDTIALFLPVARTPAAGAAPTHRR
jgi:oxygen-independent coproporphyrinogen-3 oxidase